MKTLLIREAKTEDAPYILAVNKSAFQLYADELGLPSQIKALRESEEDVINDIRSKIVLVAEASESGEILGSLRLSIINKDLAYLSRFGVEPTIHNLGIGKELIGAAGELLLQMGVKVIALHTAAKMIPQATFYYKMGFYVRETSTERGYVRALFLKELVPFEGILNVNVYSD